MKDILFLTPIYYTENFVERMRQYLVESGTKYTYDVYFCCSNPKIASVVKDKAAEYGFLFQERENMAGGEGALWFLQKKSGIDFTQYRYIWYLEESCEPIRKDWIDKLIGDMDKGVPLTGWDWHFEAKKRSDQIKHVVKNEKGDVMIAYENTEKSGLDVEGNTWNKIWDVPVFRDETFVVSAKDFMDFEYPDASDPSWNERNGMRGYAVRAERVWWDVADQAVHGFKYDSPNIQWVVLNKHHFVPSIKNEYYWYFRELSWEDRKSPDYHPEKMNTRRIKHVLRDFFSFYWRQLYAFLKIKLWL